MKTKAGRERRRMRWSGYFKKYVGVDLSASGQLQIVQFQTVPRTDTQCSPIKQIYEG